MSFISCLKFLKILKLNIKAQVYDYTKPLTYDNDITAKI